MCIPILMFSIDLDDVTKDLATQLSDDGNIEALGKVLGFSPNEVGRYIDINYQGRALRTLGTEKMIGKWIEERPVGSDILEDLRKCFIKAKLIRLSEKIPKGK